MGVVKTKQQVSDFLTSGQNLAALALAVDAEECERDLSTFMRRAWNIVDPSHYVHNWSLDAVADHLMAVNDGTIRKLLINLPPRMAKSLEVSVFWPAWTWANRFNAEYPLLGPQVRFLCLSYAQPLALDAARHHRRLVASPWYRERWGTRVQIDPRHDLQEEFATTARGIRYSLGFGGSVLGRGGDIRICFPPEEIVHTEVGPVTFAEMVERRLPLRVWSFNERRQQVELRRVTGWHRNPGAPLVRVGTSAGSLTCTVDHKIRRADGVYVRADELRVGDNLTASPSGMVFAAPSVTPAPGQVLPCAAGTDRRYVRFGDAVAGGEFDRCVSAGKNRLGLLTRQFVSALCESAVALTVLDILRASTVSEIIKPVVQWIAVKMARVKAFGSLADEGGGYDGLNLSRECFAAPSKIHAAIPFAGTNGWLEDLLRLKELSHRPIAARDFCHAAKRFNLAPSGGHIVGESWNVTPNFDRITSITHLRGGSETFCLSVDGNRNMVVGTAHIICSNCDDAHKPDEVESELVRSATIRQYDEELALRITDPRTSAEVVVMQRLAENDLAGHLLEAGGDDLVHLCLPLEYDPMRHCVTVLGWQDPRGLDDDGELLAGLTEDKDGKPVLRPGSPMAKAEGTLLWPERFPREEVEKLKTRLGPFAVAGRLQQAPVPRGGGILKSEWWRLWSSDTYPDFSTVLVSLDTASTEKEENDEAALTAWGVWADDNSRPQIMLIDAWEGFLEFDPLVRRTIEMCRAPNKNPSCKADILLVEAKNIGHPVMSEIIRLNVMKDWQVIPFNPIGDKVTRAISVQHMFSGTQHVDPETGMRTWSGGVVWAPDRDWAQLVIDRAAGFPRGKRKGLVDTVVQALKYLRDGGVILRNEESEEEQLEARRYQKPRRALYDV